jgi:recombinational DNA repair ATPase RecF
MDNLNTHTIASLYETFPADTALKMAQRLEMHFTPKHGSWLNMAEIELSALTSQCLNRRIDNMPKLRKEIRAWQHDRNKNKRTIKWQFTTADARIQLHSLYPVI